MGRKSYRINRSTRSTSPQGPQGPQGPAGTNGTNGSNGAQGPAGPTGPAGSDATISTTQEGGSASHVVSIHFGQGEGVATFTLANGSEFRLAFAR